jgi:hypothetical protein
MSTIMWTRTPPRVEPEVPPVTVRLQAIAVASGGTSFGKPAAK